MTDNATPLVSIESLRKEYATPGAPLVVLADVSLRVAVAGSAAIMGPSGSGKSTLLHILGALDQPTAGKVVIGGRDPFALSAKEQAAFRNREIGFVFQEHCLLPQLNVLENVLTPTLVGVANEAEVIERAKKLIDRVGLSGRLTHRPGQLSGGERQRAAVARALINKPKLLLGDEPTGNLDRKTSESLAELLLELQGEEAITMVVVTHSDTFAKKFQAAYELLDGKLIATT